MLNQPNNNNNNFYFKDFHSYFFLLNPSFQNKNYLKTKPIKHLFSRHYYLYKYSKFDYFKI